MIRFKFFFGLLLSILFTVSAFASLTLEEVRRQLFSDTPFPTYNNSVQQFTLNFLIRTGRAHQFSRELTEMALSEGNSSVNSSTIIDILFNISRVVVDGGEIIIVENNAELISINLESNGFRLYLRKDRLHLLQQDLSSEADKQIKALRSLQTETREVYHPFVQYILLREIVFQPADERVLKEFINIVLSSPELQQWLMRIAIGNSVSEKARTNANNILTNIKLDLRTQEDLWRIASLETTAGIVRNGIIYIMTHSPYISEAMEVFLVREVSNNDTSTAVRHAAMIILADRQGLHQKTQESLLNKLITSEKLPHVVRAAIQHIFVFNTYISQEIASRVVDLAFMDKISDTARAMAQEILHSWEDMALNAQEKLFTVSTSNEHSNAIKEAAMRVLISKRLSIDFQYKLLDIILQPSVYTKIERKAAKRILGYNEFISPNVVQSLSFPSRCFKAFKKIQRREGASKDRLPPKL